MLVHLSGRLRKWLFNNVVCKTRHKGCGVQKKRDDCGAAFCAIRGDSIKRRLEHLQRTPEHRIPPCTVDVGALDGKVERTAQMRANYRGEAVVDDRMLRCVGWYTVSDAAKGVASSSARSNS